MAYLIAAASSDGNAIDRHFGHSDCFSILAVADDGSYVLKERRSLTQARRVLLDGGRATGVERLNLPLPS